MLQMLSVIPQLSIGTELKKYEGQGSLTEMKINLKDFTRSIADTELGGEFPICEDSAVSLPWKHTYFVGSGDK